jgi:hypothetical protein
MKVFVPFFFLFLTVAAQSSDLETRANALMALPTVHEGPNCWNTSMMVLGALDHYRFVDLTEFEYYLRKYCEPLKNRDDLAHGNLIVESEVVQGWWGTIDHSFVYFSEDRAFGKDSRGASSKPHYDRFEEAFLFSEYRDFSVESPGNGLDGIGRPFHCDFSFKPKIPETIAPVLEQMHKLNTGEILLTDEVYQSLLGQVQELDNGVTNSHSYSRTLMISIREQLHYYSNYLSN